MKARPDDPNSIESEFAENNVGPLVLSQIMQGKRHTSVDPAP